MTKSELWNEIKTKYKFVNNTELLNSTGKTYAQVTKEELRKYYNHLIDVEIEVDEIVANLAKEMELENDNRTMFVAIKIDGFYSIYLVDVSTMTKTFTSNVHNADGIQIVNEEFLSKFSETIDDDVVNPTVKNIVETLSSLEQFAERQEIRHRKKWNANVNKFNSIVNILFSV